MEESGSLREELREIRDMLSEKKQKEKPFRIPFRGKVSKKKARDGWTTALIIRDNRNVDFKKFKTDEGTITVDEVPRIATAEETLLYKGRPFLILPSWSTKPFSPSDNYDEITKYKYAAAGHRLLLNQIKKEVYADKKKIGGMGVFIVIIGVIALGYFAWKSGWLG